MLKSASLLLTLFLACCAGMTGQTYNVVFVDSVTDPQCTGGTITGLADQATAKALVEACVKIQRQDPPTLPPPVEIPLDNLFAGMLLHWAKLEWTPSLTITLWNTILSAPTQLPGHGVW